MLANLFRHLIRRKPVSALPPVPAPGGDDWVGEALQLRQQGRNREIAVMCRTVLARRPNDIDALNFLAAALLAQGLSQEGVACLRRVLELTPEAADTHANLAHVLAATGDPDGAIAHYRHAVRLRADFYSAWRDLATLLKALWRYDEAEACCRAALSCDTQRAGAHQALGDVLFEQGRVDEAISALRVAHSLAPDEPALHSDLLRMLNYTDTVDPATLHAEHTAWAERHARPLEAGAAPHANDPDPRRRLRIGYVSPWFHRHPITFFLEPVVENRDRDNFDVFLYTDVAQPDEYSERLIGYGAVWRKTSGMSHEDLARTIRDDGIDILVDLTGHTGHNRLLTFARRPAPVQANWLGFPSTTGMTGMDYRITDAYCDPPGTTEHLNSEQLVRLPGVYMAWRAPQPTPDVGPLPAAHDGRITFGSFNSCYKITPALVALWSRVLARVPRSRLMLLAIDGEVAARRIRDLFAGHGITGERLDFIPRLKFDAYFAAHQQADIALDSFPYHGATTTCACLWMGLPVVVLAGVTHAARADVSMLSNVGLPQLVAQNRDQYVEIAARLADDLPGLAKLRADLRGMMQRSPLTDGLSCARHLESAFRGMWVRWCRSRERA